MEVRVLSPAPEREQRSFYMSSRGAERREFITHVLGAVAGASIAVLGLETKEALETSDLIGLRTRQLVDYYSFLRENGSLGRYEVKRPTYWFEGSLVAANREGKPVLVLPQKPTITRLETIGLEINGDRSIRLTGMSASLVNIRGGKAVFDEAFHYRNVDGVRKISELPELDDRLRFSDIHFWTRGERILIDDTKALEDLGFAISVYYDTYKLIGDEIVKTGFIADQDVTQSRVGTGEERWKSATFLLNHSELLGSSPAVLQPAAIESPRYGAVVSEVQPPETASDFTYYLLI